MEIWSESCDRHNRAPTPCCLPCMVKRLTARLAADCFGHGVRYSRGVIGYPTESRSTLILTGIVTEALAPYPN